MEITVNDFNYHFDPTVVAVDERELEEVASLTIHNQRRSGLIRKPIKIKKRVENFVEIFFNESHPVSKFKLNFLNLEIDERKKLVSDGITSFKSVFSRDINYEFFVEAEPGENLIATTFVRGAKKTIPFTAVANISANLSADELITAAAAKGFHANPIVVSDGHASFEITGHIVAKYFIRTFTNVAQTD